MTIYGNDEYWRVIRDGGTEEPVAWVYESVADKYTFDIPNLHHGDRFKLIHVYEMEVEA